MALLLLSSGLYLVAAITCGYVINRQAKPAWLLWILMLLAMWHFVIYGGMALGIVDDRTGGADYLRGLQPVWASLIIIVAQYSRRWK